MSTLEIAILGTPKIVLNGQPLSPPAQQQTLLAYLITRQHQASREEAINLFWLADHRGRGNNFRALLSKLKNQLGEEWFTGEELQLIGTQPGLAIDLWQFRAVVERLSSNRVTVAEVETAVRLYRGPITAKPTLAAETANNPFDRWLRETNEAVEAQLQAAYRWLMAYYQRLNQFDQAIEYAQQWLALDDLHEPAYRELMLLYAAAGRTAEAMRLCKQLRQKLHDELGAEPDPDTQALCEKLRRPQPEQDEATDDQPPTPPPPSPYKGLAAFTENDTDLFYGRQRFIDELQQAVAHQPLVALTGASGSGKSSLLQAGLLSRLRHHPHWLLAPVVRPETAPLDSVVEALLQLLEPHQLYDLRREARLRLVDKITTGQLTLVELGLDILRQHPPQTRLLLTVDPFEELYTQTDKQSRRLFITQLLDLVDYRRPSSTLSPFVVVIALRADFLGEVYDDERLTAALRQRTLVLGPMNTVEIQEAIEQPATRRGVLFEAGLVQRLLDEVADEPGQLPLLQFTLAELWQRQTGRRLRHAAYDGLGGVERALSHYATTVYEGLEPEEKPFARHIFVQLVVPQEGANDVRRRARRGEVPEAGWPVVQKLAQQRLLVLGQDEANRETVEVAHEALLHVWQPLKQWLADGRSFRRWQEQLRLEVARWQAAPNDAGVLLRGGPLAVAESWFTNPDHFLSETEQAFIVASQEGEKAAVAAEKARQTQALAQAQAVVLAEKRRAETAQRATQQLRWGTGVLGLLLLLAIGLGLLARDAQLEATANAAQNRSIALAETGWRFGESQPMRGLLLGVAAGGLAATEQATSLLTQQITSLPPRPLTLAHGGWVRGAAWSKDETEILIWSALKTAAAVWNAATGERRLTLHHEGDVNGAAWSKDETEILTWSDDATAAVWNAATGERRLTLQHGGWVNGAVWSKDETEILTWSYSGSDDGTAAVWDAATGERRLIFHHEDLVRGAAWSKDETEILTWSDDGTAAVWDAATGERRLTLHHQDLVTGAAWSKDETEILTWSDDGTATVWNAATGERRLIFHHEDLVQGAVWSKDEADILTWSNDETAAVWNTATGERRLTFHHEDLVRGAAWSKDETEILTWSNDGMAAIWNAATAKWRLTLPHEDLVRGAAWSKDEAEILTWSDDGTAAVWNAATGERRLTLYNEGDVEGAVWSKDATKILTWSNSDSDDGTVAVWNAATGEQRLTLQHEGRVDGAAWSKDATKIFTWINSGSDDGTAAVWDVATGERLTLQHVDRAYEKIEIPTSLRASSAMLNPRNGEVRLRLPLAIFNAFNKSRVKVWRKDGTEISTWSDDGMASVWAAATGQFLQQVEGDGTPVVAVQWNRGESQLWLITAGGMVVKEYTSTDMATLLAEACRRITRNFTWEEWQGHFQNQPYEQTCPNLPVHPTVPEDQRPKTTSTWRDWLGW